MSKFPFEDGSSRRAGNHARPHREDIPGPSDSVDVAELWAAILQHHRFILAMAAAVCSSVMLATFALGMRFTAVGQLYLGEVDRAGRISADRPSGFDLSGGAEGQVASEMQILQSPSLVRRAVLESGLNVRVSAAGQGRMSYWKWRKSGRDIALIDGVRDELRAVDTSLWEMIREPQRYQVRFTDSSSYEVRSELGKLGEGKLGQSLVAGGLTITLMRGEKREPSPGAQYELLVYPLDQMVNGALRALQVTAPKAVAGGESINVVKLEFNNGSPNLAAAFLQNLMSAYLNERQGWKTEDASAAEAFVTNQLKLIRESLDQVQTKLADYKSNNPVVVLDNEARAMVEQVGRYEEQRVAARLQAAAFADLKKTLSSPNPPMGAYLFGEADDKVLENMASSLTQAREKLTDLEARYHGPAPEVRDQRAQVAGQLEAIRNYVSSRHRRAQENLGALNAMIGQFQEKLKTVPGAELGLAQLTRESEVYSKTYSYLLERQQQAAIVKASTLSKNRILDMPQIPLWEDSPNVLLRLSSFAAGLLLGVGIIVFRTLFSSTYQSLADVRRGTNPLPFLAAVPRRVGASKNDRVNHRNALLSDVSALPGNSRFAEAFRRTRARLCTMDDAEHGKVVVVTSPTDGDGKTTCTLSIASALSAGGKSTLVVDADLRSVPQLETGATVPTVGLREVLRESCPWRNAIQPVAQRFSTFYSLPGSGTDMPELLTSGRMRRLVDEWRQAFDFVIIDCPSFPQAADALTLSQMADAIVSVIRLRKTSKALAAEHLSQLSTVTRLHGILVNDVGAERTVPAALGDSSQRLRVVDPQGTVQQNRPAQVLPMRGGFSSEAPAAASEGDPKTSQEGHRHR